MSSDRARVSYDERRRYRSVVTQQGRVTLEADENEDRLIATERLRAETLDVIGPSGTPDDGFKVATQATATTPTFDVEIGPGTLYVGGERVVLGEKLWYSAQTEWLDYVGDAYWVDPDQPAPGELESELVYLYLEEHEVGAVEDGALLEVALGGPDTAQRTRLLQRIRRVGTDGATCADAIASAASAWEADGLVRDALTQRLVSSTRLAVSYQDLGTTDNLCEPNTQGGYLGADNQLIRVEISDAGAGGQPKLVWGYDNASFVYRVEVGKDLLTLTLAAAPVDDAHRPRAIQAVEVLRAAAGLETGSDQAHDPSPEDFVAAATGVLQTLTSGYDSDQRQIVLPTPLPAVYGDTGASPVVFLRVWETETAFTPGKAIKLGATGVSVTVQTDGAKPLHRGDYWQIGVRPSTPTAVYPVRYLERPQPPDGPRLWASPLAVVRWTDRVSAVVEDCRSPFESLVELTKRRASGCCDVLVRPEDLTGGNTLQAVVDSLAGTPGTICLAAGVYALDAPLRLGPKHSGLTIEACHREAVLTAAAGAERLFADGLMVLDDASRITLRGLRFELPRVPFAAVKFQVPAAALKQFVGQLRQLFVSVGLRPVRCSLLTVDDCAFAFPAAAQENVFAAGIFAGGECLGLTVRGCLFGSEYRPNPYLKPHLHVQIGYLLAPSASVNDTSGGSLVPSRLEDAAFRENHFSGLTVAAYVYADCGLVTVADNTVRLTEVGFVLLALQSLAFGTLDAALAANLQQLSKLAYVVVAGLEHAAKDPVSLAAGFLAEAYPWPLEAIPAASAIPVTPEAANAPVDVRSHPVAKLVAQAEILFGGEPGADTVAVDPGRAEVSSTLSAGDLAAFTDARLLITKIERAALLRGQPLGLSLALHVANNDIDLHVGTLTSGPGLLAWDTPKETESALTLTGNRISVQSGGLGVVAALLVERAAVTGNILENTSGRPVSLVLVPGTTPAHGVAVAGNVLRGRPLLPSRVGGAPFQLWDVFNDVF